MWTKIEIVNDNKKTIYFPQAFQVFTDNINIHFGNKKVSARISNYNNYEPQTGFTRKKPLKIKITSELQNKLLIPSSLPYQIVLKKNELYIGPVIAFLLGNYRYNPEYMKKYNKKLKLYNYIGGLIYAFIPDTVDFEKNHITGLYYNYKTSKWKSEHLPFPSFIYRRNFSTDPQIINKLEKITSNNVYNSHRFSKIEQYKYLSENNYFKKYIPVTRKINNLNQVKKFVKSHPESILKPVNSSRGRGIYIIKKVNKNKFKFISHFNNKPLELDQKKFKNSLKRIITSGNYLIQEYLHLAEIGNSIFDFRVVMQKIKSGKWICSGIEVRKAGKTQNLTNISKGGKALTFSETLFKLFYFRKTCLNIKDKILNISYKFCNIMDKTGENFFEFGIDIALDKNNKLWFLEANTLPSFKGFKAINKNTYQFINNNTLRYAVTKTNFDIDSKFNFLI